MTHYSSFGLFGVTFDLKETIRNVFGREEVVQCLRDWDEVTEFLGTSYPLAKTLIADPEMLLPDARTCHIVTELEACPTFHLILWQADEGIETPADLASSERVHRVKASEPTARDSLIHHLYGIKSSTESVWLRAKVADVEACYEDSYSEGPVDPGGVELFVEKIAAHIGARSLQVFALRSTPDKFVPYLGHEPSNAISVERSTVEAILDFQDICATHLLSASELAQLLNDSSRSSSTPLTGFLSTFRIDGMPWFILYTFNDPRDPNLLWEISTACSREVFHLLRANEVRSRHDSLRALTAIDNLRDDEEKVLSRILDCLQLHFSANGVSVLQVLDVRDNTLFLKKTYKHHQRLDTVTFDLDGGYVHYCVTKNKALLINEVATETRLGKGLQFEYTAIGPEEASNVEISYADTPNAIEDEEEMSLMYFPLVREGTCIGALKIGEFRSSCAFTFDQLRSLAVFAPPIVSLLANISSIAQLKEELSAKEGQDRMVRQAEVLFFYREIALGIFHQVGNYLHTSSSNLLVAESLAERSGKETELSSAIRESRQPLEAAKSWIAKAQKRGQTLEPIAQDCQIVDDIVRPALEYARKRVVGSNISIETTLTDQDYTVHLDPELAKESIINILNNAIWAVKENKRSSKKEVFIAVRKLPEDRVRIEIRDSGIGVSPDIYPKLFTPFFTTRHHGTGLGLYFARRLAEHFDGTIRFLRSEPGKGSTVEVTFPIKEIRR